MHTSYVRTAWERCQRPTQDQMESSFDGRWPPQGPQRPRRPRPSLLRRSCEAIRRALAFLFSHAGVCALILAYTLFGAALFLRVEGGPASEAATAAIERASLRRRITAESLWAITVKHNVLEEARWRTGVAERIRSHQEELVAEVRRDAAAEWALGVGEEGTAGGRPQWTFAAALMYALTVYTTIGVVSTISTGEKPSASINGEHTAEKSNGNISADSDNACEAAESHSEKEIEEESGESGRLNQVGGSGGLREEDGDASRSSTGDKSSASVHGEHTAENSGGNSVDSDNNRHEAEMEEAAIYQNAVHFIADEEEEIPRFRLGRRRTKFRFNTLPRNMNPWEWIGQGVDEIIEFISGRITPEHKVGFSIYSESAPENVVHVPWRRSDQLNSETILTLFENVAQSNANFFCDGEMIITLDHARLPRGYGRVKKRGMSMEDWVKNKKCIIKICNEDTLCLARALVVAIAHKHKEDGVDAKRRWDAVRRYHSGLQQKLALDLCRRANVDLSNGGGLAELGKFQKHFGNEYQIMVYDGENKIFDGESDILDGEKTESSSILNLLYVDEKGSDDEDDVSIRGHYDVITSITAFKATSYFCQKCSKTFHNNNTWYETHICKNTCAGCHDSPICDKSLPKKKCKDCGRFFYGEECLKRHLKPLSDGRQSVCSRFHCCPACHLTFPTGGKFKHVCGEKYCNVCRKQMPEDHLCFIQPCSVKNRKNEKFIFIFYDYECTQDTPLMGGNIFEHKPNLCVTQQVCHACYDVEDITKSCKVCGKRQHVFEDNPTKEFINYIRTPLIQRNFDSVICIAHNSRGYDAHFLLRFMVEKLKWTPSLIMNGTKILSMTIPDTKIKFIDSLSYLPMPLSALPKAFDLPHTFKKGYFPHFFNKDENKCYIGPIPDVSFYGADSMKCDERNEFLKWYEEEVRKGVEFNFSKELIDYCVSDVNILRMACIKFHRTFLRENDVDPFREAITIASACNKVYRRKFMEKNSIGLLPKDGYRWRDCQSRLAVKWLTWEERKRAIEIQHAGKGMEKKILNYKVDGYFQSEDTREIFQFHGCFWHGHTCQKNRKFSFNDNLADNMDFRLERTNRITGEFRKKGFKVTEMWECEFREFLSSNPEIDEELSNAPFLKEGISAREGFFGGRTNATKLYYKADRENGEKIKYLDVCSLYPYVCKYGKFPIGHPKKIHVDESTFPGLEIFEGIIKCVVIPPQHLYHPVLPVRINKKLIFTLCRKCAEGRGNLECFHGDMERSLTGTWVADELRLAVSKGYEIKEIIEAWEYDVVGYTPENKTSGLFGNYINAFLKMKQEASGWPESCLGNDERKEEYVKKYFEKEGIKLDPNNIRKNSGSRALAKLMLNSFWGKFGQRENKPKTIIIKDPAEFFKILSDPGIIVNNVLPITHEILYINYESVEDSIEPLSTVNVVIASYTTAMARIKLYEYLDKLKERVLYYDTDSVIFTEKDDEWSPPTGEYLGDLTDELEGYGEGSYITEFVSGGPKNYAYIVSCGGDAKKLVQVCKVKGITLNYRTCQLINFEQLKKMVTQNGSAVTVEYPNKIARTRAHSVISYTHKKTQRIVYDKRKRVGDFDTHPYGYKNARVA